ERTALVTTYLADAQKNLAAACSHVDDIAVALDTLAWVLVAGPEPRCYDPPRALKLAQRAVEKAPKDVHTWRTLGAAQYRSGQWQAALISLEKAHQLQSRKDTVTLLFLAMAQARNEDVEQARERFDEAAALLPGLPSAEAESAQRLRDEAASVLGI